MTYVNVGATRVPKRGSRELGAVYIDIGAVGDESALIQEEYKRSVDHYLFPFTAQWANPVTKFFRLKNEWEDNTAHLSSVTESAMHPAYQQIIGMGPVAIPLILEEMRKLPGQWFWALKAITGEDPILPEQRGRIKHMTVAWLQWGREHGYIA